MCKEECWCQGRCPGLGKGWPQSGHTHTHTHTQDLPVSAGAWLQPSSHLPVPLSRKARAWQWQPWHWALLLPQERALNIRHPHRLQSGALGPFPRQSKRVGALRGRSGSSGGKPPLCKLSTNSHLGVSRRDRVAVCWQVLSMQHPCCTRQGRRANQARSGTRLSSREKRKAVFPATRTPVRPSGCAPCPRPR